MTDSQLSAMLGFPRGGYVILSILIVDSILMSI